LRSVARKNKTKKENKTMKKIMIACAAVALAAVAQAASINWEITGNSWTLADGNKAAKGTSVYLIDAAQWSIIEAAVKGGQDTFTTADAGILGVGATSNTKGAVAGTATSSALTAGTTYNFAYLVLEDDKYFASASVPTAAYDHTDAVYSETQTVSFGATQFSTGSLSGGWQDVSSSDVPEPTSGLLLLLGVAGLALKRKRA
jgi:hypothetical protein